LIQPNSAQRAEFCIVTPAFNKEAFVERTIQSILSQNGFPTDYRIVDGGSSDRTPEILTKYSEKLRWSSETGISHYAAVNKAFAGCDSEFMGIVNADDVYFQDTLGLAATVFRRDPKIQWLAPKQLVFLDGMDRITAVLPTEERKTLNDCLLEWKVPGLYANLLFMPPSGVFWRKDLWQRAGGRMDESLHFAGEMDLWCRFLDLGANPLFVDWPLVGIREHTFRGEGVFRTAIAKEAPEIFRKHGFAPRSKFEQWAILRYRTLKRSIRKRIGNPLRKVTIEFSGRTISGKMQ
jgi:glycosyltransferase involved in cell wall biosynthesis